MWQTRRVASWFLIGLTASLVELALLRLLYEGAQWPLPVATAAAAETLILVKFLVTDRWVFSHASPTLDRLVRYHGASAGAFIVYWLVVNGLAVLLGVDVRASAVGVRASGVDVDAVRVRISAGNVAVAEAEPVAVAQVRRAVASHAQHDRYERKERAECETGQEKGFHMPLNWLVGVLLV